MALASPVAANARKAARVSGGKSGREAAAGDASARETGVGGAVAAAAGAVEAGGGVFVRIAVVARADTWREPVADEAQCHESADASPDLVPGEGGPQLGETVMTSILASSSVAYLAS
jgi:hypothetical protein